MLWCEDLSVQSSLVCGLCTVVCGDFENFQSSPVCVCGLCAVVCEDFENLQRSPVCGLCTAVCGDFENFQRAPVYGLCTVVCGDFRPRKNLPKTAAKHGVLPHGDYIASMCRISIPAIVDVIWGQTNLFPTSDRSPNPLSRNYRYSNLNIGWTKSKQFSISAHILCNILSYYAK